ncbi:MAG: dTDP-4-dehydrorhamnose 3,5-epimerase [Bacteroidota bacterium]|nr:dTDP-4-dehydrorhamnose 3,5-epimerase [Bacteroidota bacterium]
MNIIETKLPGLFLIEPKVFADDRGYFFESYNESLFKENGLDYSFVQDNESMSSYGVIRGLHYQLAPYSQAKLIRVLEGAILDVAVDIRENSPTFGQWQGFEISGENKKQLLIPRGFAHGFSVLSKKVVFIYKCDNLYFPEADRGINFADKSLNIDWGIDTGKALVSPKDKILPSFGDAEKNFIFNQ